MLKESLTDSYTLKYVGQTDGNLGRSGRKLTKKLYLVNSASVLTTESLMSNFAK